jgi:hypothetical protein
MSPTSTKVSPIVFHNETFPATHKRFGPNQQALRTLCTNVPLLVHSPIFCKSEKEVSLMAPVSNVPDLSSNVMPLRSCHLESYVALFTPEKAIIGQ